MIIFMKNDDMAMKQPLVVKAKQIKMHMKYGMSIPATIIKVAE